MMFWIASATYVHATVGGVVHTRVDGMPGPDAFAWWTFCVAVLATLASSAVAGFTWRLAAQTKKLAGETNTMATETKNLATETLASVNFGRDAIAGEDRRHQQQYAPLVALEVSDADAGGGIELVARNLGFGLALNTMIFLEGGMFTSVRRGDDYQEEALGEDDKMQVFGAIGQGGQQTTIIRAPHIIY